MSEEQLEERRSRSSTTRPPTDPYRRVRRGRRGHAPACRPAPPEGGTEDAVRLYLQNIGRVTLLTKADEVRLAKRVEQNDMTAKNDLIEANLRLVVSVAKRYQGRGLTLWTSSRRATWASSAPVEKFDWRRGFKFSTYATWWIRQSMTRALADQSRTIRIPVHMVERMNKVAKARRELSQQLERDPTLEEIAAKVEMKPSKVEELLKLGQEPLSLESPVGAGDDPAQPGGLHRGRGPPAPRRPGGQAHPRRRRAGGAGQPAAARAAR